MVEADPEGRTGASLFMRDVQDLQTHRDRKQGGGAELGGVQKCPQQAGFLVKEGREMLSNRTVLRAPHSANLLEAFELYASNG